MRADLQDTLPGHLRGPHTYPQHPHHRHVWTPLLWQENSSRKSVAAAHHPRTHPALGGIGFVGSFGEGFGAFVVVSSGASVAASRLDLFLGAAVGSVPLAGAFVAGVALALAGVLVSTRFAGGASSSSGLGSFLGAGSGVGLSLPACCKTPEL